MRLERVLGVALFVAVPACAEASNPPASATVSPPSATAPAVTTNDSGKPAKAPKLICKRVPVVGSNVGTERVCVPRNDVRKTGESRAQDLRGRNSANNGN